MALQRSLFTTLCKQRVHSGSGSVRAFSTMVAQQFDASSTPNHVGGGVSHHPSSDYGVSPACAKLVSALETYRQENYGQTLFSRYVKEMVQAMDANSDGKISFKELKSLLHNIGADQEVTTQDVQAIVDELGEGEPKEIHVDYVEDLILGVGKLKDNDK